MGKGIPDSSNRKEEQKSSPTLPWGPVGACSSLILALGAPSPGRGAYICSTELGARHELTHRFANATGTFPFFCMCFRVPNQKSDQCQTTPIVKHVCKGLATCRFAMKKTTCFSNAGDVHAKIEPK